MLDTGQLALCRRDGRGTFPERPQNTAWEMYNGSTRCRRRLPVMAEDLSACRLTIQQRAGPARDDDKYAQPVLGEGCPRPARLPGCFTSRHRGREPDITQSSTLLYRVTTCCTKFNTGKGGYKVRRTLRKSTSVDQEKFPEFAEPCPRPLRGEPAYYRARDRADSCSSTRRKTAIRCLTGRQEDDPRPESRRRRSDPINR